jgi:hypothetical protein
LDSTFLFVSLFTWLLWSFLLTTWLLLDSLDLFGWAWCDGSLTSCCCLAMVSLIFLLLCDGVLTLQPLWLSPLCKKRNDQLCYECQY